MDEGVANIGIVLSVAGLATGILLVAGALTALVVNVVASADRPPSDAVRRSSRFFLAASILWLIICAALIASAASID